MTSPLFELPEGDWMMGNFSRKEIFFTQKKISPTSFPITKKKTDSKLL